MDRFSFLGAAHIALIDDVYEQYLQEPDKVESSWRAFFQGYDFAKEVYGDDHSLSLDETDEVPDHVRKEFLVIKLIEAYRVRGHLFTQTNPVRERRKYTPTLDIENYGLSEADHETVFQAATQVGNPATSLKSIITHLEKVYCQSIGVEYMYIRRPEEVLWIQAKLNKEENQPKFEKKTKLHILHKLNEAVAFEAFLHKKFVGQKRFSLEGAESLIPAIDALIELGAKLGAEEFVVGMAHRGRLNVLANVFGKTFAQIFSEFETKDFEDQLFDGDVKYHLGYTTERTLDNGEKVRLNISPNPSHLEAVDAVVEGITRSKINNVYQGDNNKIVPVLIHGDAAIAGQGIVYEVIQMEQLDGYKTGGTVHIVVNNQVGFTTNYLDARSSTYCTDVGKVTLSPVLHVNGDDVEAVVHAVKFAVEYRQTFHKDVFIDLLSYRKYGHNEGDEPRFTQPNLYKLIAKHPNPRQIYSQKLIAEGNLEQSQLKAMETEFKELLEGKYDESKKIEKNIITPFMQEDWNGFRQGVTEELLDEFDTSFEEKELKRIGDVITTIPEGKNLYKKTQRLLADRKKMLVETDRLDWAMGELLAYGSLLSEGYNVRISGQDVERGTFSHRHAVLKVDESEEEIVLLNHLGNDQGRFAIYNSLLSEYGVLGFDYGYSIADPNTLTIWEAQFGDFSNGAQIMIDQFISAGEDKWKITSGLVMLLPHGYEGQGAEHSSARMERYLQLCADYNMQCANVTAPANFFHLLRRQMKRDYRKPLVVFTPKSLLRHPKAVSSVKDLISGSFQELIEDEQMDAKKVKKVVFCSGKIYYELLAERKAREDTSTALVRLEQLYPLPIEEIHEVLSKYSNAEKIVWTQEEPANMGAWMHLTFHLPEVPFTLVSRDASSAPATGSAQRAKKRQRKVVEETFDI